MPKTVLRTVVVMKKIKRSVWHFSVSFVEGDKQRAEHAATIAILMKPAIPSPLRIAVEQAMKIRKYVKQRNVAQLPKSVQDIIRDQQDEATRLEAATMDELKKAIVNAEFYVAGEHIEVKAGDAKAKIDQALEYLVSHVYSELDLITKNAETDADILEILLGNEQMLAGTEPNRDAAAKMEEYLEVQYRKNLPTSMADVQSRYQAIPYKDPFEMVAEYLEQIPEVVENAG